MEYAFRIVLCSFLAFCAGCADLPEEDPEAFGSLKDAALPNSGNGIANEIFPWVPAAGNKFATTPVHTYMDLDNNAIPPGVYQDEMILTPPEMAARALEPVFTVVYDPDPRPVNQDEWRSRTRKFGAYMEHLVVCALSPSQTVTLRVRDGAGEYETYTETVTGQLGLATEWRTGDIVKNTRAQQIITACLLAVTNKDGYSVSVSIRAPDDYPSLHATASEKASYRKIEGAFWGNTFTSKPWHRSCHAGDRSSQELARRLGRNCSGSSRIDKCDGISVAGACDTVCTENYNEDATGHPRFDAVKAPGATNTEGYTACEGSDEVITVFVDEESSTAGRFLGYDNYGWNESNWVRCAEGESVAGIAVSFGDTINVLCRKDRRIRDIDGETYTVGFAPDTDVNDRSARKRWLTDDSKHYIQCGEDEYISGVELSWGHVKAIECKKAYLRGDRCRSIDLSLNTSARRSNDASGNWWRDFTDPDNVPVECDLNERATALVFGSGGDPGQKGLLCCAF